MKTPIFLVLLSCVWAGCTNGNLRKDANKDILLSFEDGKGHYGYTDIHGREVIPPLYPMVFSDTFSGEIAFVAAPKQGIIAINRQNQTLLSPFIFDNGPDPASEGLFRFVENKKMGFADLDGNKVIPAKYTFVDAFHEGFAAFCEGCKVRKMGEIRVWSGGKWGFLDKAGKVAIAPIFDDVQSFEQGKARVKLGKESLTINTKGVVTP